jgi:gas vesicle protein
VERARAKACEKWEQLNEAWEAEVQTILLQEETDVADCAGSTNVFQCVERAKKKKQQALCDLKDTTKPKFDQAMSDLQAALNKCCEIAKRATAECCG